MSATPADSKQAATRTFVSSRRIYYFLGFVAAIFIVIGVTSVPGAVWWRRMLAGATVAVIVYGPLWLYIRRYIVIAHHILTYHPPLGRQRSVDLGQLQRVYVRRRFWGNAISYVLILQDTAGGRVRFAISPGRLKIGAIWADEDSLFDTLNGYARAQAITYDTLTTWALTP